MTCPAVSFIGTHDLYVARTINRGDTCVDVMRCSMCSHEHEKPHNQPLPGSEAYARKHQKENPL